MLNEGIHIKDVDGVVMLRPTISPIVYLQQIGRCLACSSDGSTSPVIFDLVNNYESARVEESGQRVFNIEFPTIPAVGKGRTRLYPFTCLGSPHNSKPSLRSSIIYLRGRDDGILLLHPPGILPRIRPISA